MLKTSNFNIFKRGHLLKLQHIIGRLFQELIYMAVYVDQLGNNIRVFVFAEGVLLLLCILGGSPWSCEFLFYSVHLGRSPWSCEFFFALYCYKNYCIILFLISNKYLN